MGTVREVRVPEIGDFESVEVIEVLVEGGQGVEEEQSLITLESDKATMEIPSPYAGEVKSVSVSVGDRVAEGSLILTMETTDVAADASTSTEPSPASSEPASAAPTEPPPAAVPPSAEQSRPAPAEPVAGGPTEPGGAPRRQALAGGVEEVHVPEIGDFEEVDVIEVLVAVGERVSREQSLITLESDKATMEIPSPAAGVVRELRVAVGDTVSEGSPVLLLQTGAEPLAAAPSGEEEPLTDETLTARTEPAEEETRPADLERRPGEKVAAPPPVREPAVSHRGGLPHASPGVRQFARELGVDLYQVAGSGPKRRVLKEDVQSFVKEVMQHGPKKPPAGFVLPEIPAVDFARFGEVETRSLSRIKKLSAAHLHRCWLNVPHVTQHDEADISELETFRRHMMEEGAHPDVRLSPLVFLMRASVSALKAYPEFNASLAPGGDQLVLKKYYHIGVAVDTPQGLVVPVVRDVDKKGLYELAAEVAEAATRARDGKLAPEDLQGGCFTISSLGGIGGTAFTPIVNAPEVAILGVSRVQRRPVYGADGALHAALLLPLSLSYDHRVIDGAAAARFTSHLSAVLGDIRRLLL